MRFSAGQLSFCQLDDCAAGRAGGACPCASQSSRLSTVASLRAVLRRDPGTMGLLRSLMAHNGFSGSNHLTEDSVLAFVGDQLASGRFRLCQIRISSAGITKSSVSTAPAKPVEKPFPLAERQQRSQPGAEPAIEASLFPPNVEMQALAPALIEASSDGLPLCEECQKAAANG